MAKERKTITFSVYDMDLYNEVKERFPENTGSEENLRILLESLAEVKSLKTKYAACVVQIESLNNQVDALLHSDNPLEAVVKEYANQVSEQLEKIEQQQATIGSLSAQMEEMRNHPVIETLEVMQPLPTNAILLECNALEHHLLSVVARKDKCTVKEMLVNRFFFMYQYRGPGDYNISLLKKDYLKRIRNTYENEL